MNKKIKRTISLLCTVIIVLGFCGCSNNEQPIKGNGTPGEIADLHWEDYDNPLIESQKEKDVYKRSELLHKAEEKLMKSGANIPICFNSKYILAKPFLEGIYWDPNGYVNLTTTKRTDGEKSLSASILTEPGSLDTSGDSTANSSTVNKHIFSNLVKLDKDFSAVPEMAQSYSISEDETVYTFYLRDNLKWSDGSDFSAKDFEYAWKRAADTKNALEYGSLFNIIKGYPDNLEVKSSDDGKTLTVTLNHPCPYFLQLCAFAPFAPLKQEFVESAEGYKNEKGEVVNPKAWAREANIVSNGPYTITEWKHNEKIVLKKNPYYYDADNIYLETINCMLSTDSSASYSAYKSDDIQLMNQNIPNDAIPLLKDSREFTNISTYSLESVVVNTSSDIFKGLTMEEAETFRQAIGYAINRQFIVDVALTGTETPATTYIKKDMKIGENYTYGETYDYKYPLEEGFYPKDGDLDTAREMLKSLGLKFGNDGKLINPITIEYSYNSNAKTEAIAVCIQADLAQLGITMIPSNKEFNVFIGERNKGQYEFGRQGWNPDFIDPYAMLSIFQTGDSNNCIIFNNK